MRIKPACDVVGTFLLALALLASPALVLAGPVAPQTGPGSTPVLVYNSAKTWGGTDGDILAKHIALDQHGNRFVVGEFSGTVDFDPAGLNASATFTSTNGTVDAFLSKFDAGGRLVWVHTWGGGQPGDSKPQGRDAANGVALDAQGHIYVAGLYQETVNFGNGLSATSNAPSGSNNIYLLQFDASGTPQWLRTWGGTTGGEAYSVAVDKWGYVYVEGDWSTGHDAVGVDFNPRGPTHDLHYNHGMYDAFLARYDSSGNFQWAKTWGGWGYDDGPGVAVDNAGGVYVAGMYGSQDINFDPAGTSKGLGHPASDNSYVYVDVFLSKFDSNGNFQWVRTWGGQGVTDAGEVVTLDRAGYVYIGGRFQCVNCNFNVGANGPANPPDPHSTHGNFDAFVSKFSPDGVFQWARTWGGTLWDATGGMAVDPANNLYAGEIISGTMNSWFAVIDSDAASAKFTPDGTLQWQRAWGNAGIGQDVTCVWDLAVDGANNLYTVGSFQGTVNFNPDGGVDSHPALGTDDAFLTTFLSATPVTAGASGVVTITTDTTTTVAFPAPDAAITLTQEITGTYPVTPGLSVLGPTFFVQAVDGAGAPVTSFNPGVTVTVSYDPNLLGGLDPTTLQIYYWAAEAGVWQPLATTVDTVKHILSALTNQLHTFAVFGQPLPPVAWMPFITR